MQGPGDIKLGGRLFGVVNYDAISVRNEHYVMKWMRQTGIDRVMPLPEGETNEQYMARLQGALIDTMKVPELLGGFLLPQGKTEADWTPALAAETTRFVAGLNAADDRAEVQRLAMLIAFDFFRVGIASVRRSESALQTLSEASPGEKQNASAAAH